MRRENDCAAAPGRACGAVTQDSSSTAKATGGRPEAQGNRTARNPDQRPPVWPTPPGADAARDLAAAWSRSSIQGNGHGAGSDCCAPVADSPMTNAAGCVLSRNARGGEVAK